MLTKKERVSCYSSQIVYCVETTELIIKQLALHCSLETVVYEYQTWNMYLKHWRIYGALRLPPWYEKKIGVFY